MTYELKLAQYSGPLDKLLELIEARQLEITQISLAEVTDDFLRYLTSIKDAVSDGTHADLRLLADFIVVASRLIFIKSKSLLPDLTLTESEEEDIHDLEHRLKLYRELRPAMKHLTKLWQLGHGLHDRAYFLNLGRWFMPDATAGEAEPTFFYPGRNTTDANLRDNLSHLFVSFETLIKENEVIQGTILSLEEKISEITQKLKTLAATSFADLSRAQPRGERIVTFLAILYLAREQLIYVEQVSHLSDIIIRKTGNSE